MAKPILLYPFRNRIKNRGLGPDELAQWLEYLSPSIVKWEEDFVNGPTDAACEDIFGHTLSGGSMTGTILNTANGICRLASGSTGDNYIGVYPNGGEGNMGACYLGNNSAVIWARIKADSAAECKIEVGFIDDDDFAGAVTTLATPTAYASDFAVWCYDTADEGGLFWQGVHGIAGGTPSKIEPGKFLPVANTYEWMGVALLGDAVKFMHCDAYGNPNYESGWQAAGITATDPLSPWIFVQTRDTSEILLDIDYVIAYQRRTADDDGDA